MGGVLCILKHSLLIKPLPLYIYMADLRGYTEWDTFLYTRVPLLQYIISISKC